jgi:hypothetical protein
VVKKWVLFLLLLAACSAGPTQPDGGRRFVGYWVFTEYTAELPTSRKCAGEISYRPSEGVVQGVAVVYGTETRCWGARETFQGEVKGSNISFPLITGCIPPRVTLEGTVGDELKVGGQWIVNCDNRDREYRYDFRGES